MSRRRPALTRPRRLLTGLALGGLLVPLAACSGGGDTEAFCQGGEDATAQMTAAGELADDPQAFADAISEARAGFEDLDAPEEIAADWEVFTTTFAELDDSLQEIDPTDQEAFLAALTDFSEQADTEDLTTASDNLSTFFSENCEA